MIWRVAMSSFVLFGAAILGMWVNDREPPVAITEVNVLTPDVNPGGELRVEYKVTRWRVDCSVQADRLIRDSKGTQFPLPDLNYARIPGNPGADVTVTPVPVPPNISEGPALYRSIASFSCNPVHRLWPIVRQAGNEARFNVQGPTLGPQIIIPPGSVIIPPVDPSRFNETK